ncbi:hypothetical protein PHISCL_03031 [Aspergillus sclerotialis]|uniref:Uncharacterized protein n=1 Tax=Aspergillus sclerotialis TaxID=2070753 RepID=A0A3A2ZT76_9EURO|nr:hypothetical protein PHISCL_03031 [Aspergillus sclerotialis]
MEPPPYPEHNEYKDRKYKSVPESEAETDIALPELEQKGPEEPAFVKRQSFLRRRLVTILLILLSLTTILLIATITAAITVAPLRTYIHKISKTERPVLGCGQTVMEAEEIGCEFDPLAACWMHPECPRDYTDEFLTYLDGRPFAYYYDQAATRRIESWQNLSRLGYYWSSTREHLVHCSFILRRGHDTRNRGARVDSMAGDLHHSDHCSQFLMDNLGKSDEQLDQIGTYGEVGFLTC